MTEEKETSQPAKEMASEADNNLVQSMYCACKNQQSCQQCGIPFDSRETTKLALTKLQERPPLSNVYGNGTLLVSDVPKSSSNTSSDRGIVLGIDEAGRGCVLGPMVYGLAYWSADESTLTKPIPKGFNDSKQLSDEARRSLFQQLVDHPDIGFIMRSLLPSEISRNMLRTEPYNLNQMSHDTAFCMIRKLLNANVKIEKCFIDTVGNAYSYQRRLEQLFPGIEFVVESKADAKYAPCSAASVGKYLLMYIHSVIYEFILYMYLMLLFSRQGHSRRLARRMEVFRSHTRKATKSSSLRTTRMLFTRVWKWISIRSDL